MSFRIQIAIAAASVFLAGAAAAQQPSPGAPHTGPHAHGSGGHESMMRQGMGGGMARGPVGLLTAQDANSGADMGITMNLVHANRAITRTVTRLPDGIKTVTESDNPRIAQDIKAHVASMVGRLDSGKEFNIFSKTLPAIFDHAKQIKTNVEFTAKGAVVIQTSADPKLVLALQGHADEVTELVKGGPAAFHRGIDARMAMGANGPRGAATPAAPR